MQRTRLQDGTPQAARDPLDMPNPWDKWGRGRPDEKDHRPAGASAYKSSPAAAREWGRQKSSWRWWENLAEQACPSEEDLRRFTQKWELSKESSQMLHGLEPHFCALVLRDFRPPPNNYDNNRRLTSFVQCALHRTNTAFPSVFAPSTMTTLLFLSFVHQQPHPTLLFLRLFAPGTADTLLFFTFLHHAPHTVLFLSFLAPTPSTGHRTPATEQDKG